MSISLWAENNKMVMVDVDDSSLPTGGLTAQVDWPEGWRPLGAESAFIIWTG